MSADVGTFISDQRRQLMQERRDFEGDFASDGYNIDNSQLYSQNDRAQRRREMPRESAEWPMFRKRATFEEEEVRLSGSGVLPTLMRGSPRRNKFQQERWLEYNAMLAKQQQQQSAAGRRAVTPELGLVAMLGQYDKTRQKLNEQRRVEYNQLLAAKNRQLSLKHSGIQNMGSGEGDVPELRRVLQDRPPPPRSGWATPTPTYEEILDKKRKEERNYRRYDEPDLFDRRQGGQGGQGPAEPDNFYRPSLSDGNINRRFDEEERRIKEMEREYDNRKVRFADETQQQLQQQQQQQRRMSAGAEPLRDWELGPPLASLPPPHPVNPARDERLNDGPGFGFEAQRRVAGPSQNSRRQPSNNLNNNELGATLGIGRDVRASDERQKKAAYRQELERQIQETKENKQRDKMAALMPAGDHRDGGLGAPGAGPVRRRSASLDRAPPPARDYPLPQSRDYPPQREYAAPDEDPRWNNGPPGGLSAMQSSGGYAPGLSPAEQAYHYFSQQNLLDPYQGILHQPLFAGQQQPFVPQQQQQQLYAPPPPQQPYGTQQYASLPPPPQHEAPPHVGDRSADGDELKRVNEDKKRAYSFELQKQMFESQRRKQKEKEDKEMQDRKLEQEIKDFDPFGRGGGGAPLRDKSGNVITNRKTGMASGQTTEAPDYRYMADQTAALSEPMPSMVAYLPPPGAHRANLPADLPSDDSGMFARGGNGIFGEALTEEQKNIRLKYQDDLRRQVLDKKRRAEEEKEKEKQEELRLMKKIEDDNRRIKEEQEEEKRKAQEKAEQAERQQEELRRAQEQQRKDAEQRKREAREARSEEARRQEEESRKTSPPMHRVPSGTTRVQSAEVLGHLAKMKEQLASERSRVESDLRREQVNDPRVASKPPTRPRLNVDVVDTSRQRGGGVYQTSQGVDTNMENMRQISDLRQRRRAGSQTQFRRMFPSSPDGGSELEGRQRAVLQQQDTDLRRLKLNYNMEPIEEQDNRQSVEGSPHALQSVTAFIGVPRSPPGLGEGDMPDDLEDLNPPRRSSASRSRRRLLTETPPPLSRPGSELMGSVLSLNPDEIRARNDERLKKLHGQTRGDDLSTGDPEDILDRFMSKQKHNRPPSTTTLMDDSWLRPGSGR